MTAAATTSDLYMQDDQGNAVPMGGPPAAPSPVPPPTTPVKVVQPVVIKNRMADERPDGSVRDTSGEALRPGNELGFRNLDEDPKPPAQPTPAEEPKPETSATPAPAPEAPKVERVYAGKFKSIEELEKGYEESQKAMTKAFQDKANLERQQVAKAAEPPPPPPQLTPEQQAAKAAKANEILNKFVSDPEGFVSEKIQENQRITEVALKTQQFVHDWRTANPDLVEHEFYVTAEYARLMQSDPELAKDPQRMIEAATANFRQLTGKLRNEGAREALTQETRVIPLVGSTAPPTATEQPSEAPLTWDDAFSQHLKMLKGAEQRSHRGLRR